MVKKEYVERISTLDWFLRSFESMAWFVAVIFLAIKMFELHVITWDISYLVIILLLVLARGPRVTRMFYKREEME